MTKRKVAILFAIILSLAFVSFGLAFTVTSEIVPTSGAMTVDLKNSSNVPMNASLFVYVRDRECASRIRFLNVTFVITQGENHTYLKSVDGSGIEVYIKNMKPKETVSFRVREIKVRPEFSISIGRLRIDLEPRGEATFYLDYDVVFSLIAETRLGKISVASVKSFNYRLHDFFEPKRFERTHATIYITVFFALTFCLLSSLVLYFAIPTWKTRIPLATLIVALSSVGLYTFVGSGYEILANLHPKNYQMAIFPISFLLHGYDDHLSGNFFFFLLVSLLMESWLSVRKTWKTFSVCYVLPMFFTLIHPGIGLSLSIESMTWALWTKIIHEHKTSTSFDVLMCILSGVPSIGFLNWSISYLQGGMPPYNRSLAIVHITYGVVSAVIIFGVYLGWRFQDALHKFRRRCIKILRPPLKQTLRIHALILTPNKASQTSYAVRPLCRYQTRTPKHILRETHG